MEYMIGKASELPMIISHWILREVLFKEEISILIILQIRLQFELLVLFLLWGANVD